jgi:hypothetical protein
MAGAMLLPWIALSKTGWSRRRDATGRSRDDRSSNSELAA